MRCNTLMAITYVPYFVFHLICGCSSSLPDLHEAKWVSFSVDFLVGEGSEVERQTWSTNDRRVLDRLQEQLQVKYTGTLWGIGTMTSNKIDLRLANGQRWIMYIVEPAKIAINDPAGQKGGYYLKVTPAFYESIKALIESTQEEPVYFF